MVIQGIGRPDAPAAIKLCLCCPMEMCYLDDEEQWKEQQYRHSIPKQRRIIDLAGQGISREEIARQENVTSEWVRVILRRAGQDTREH